MRIRPQYKGRSPSERDRHAHHGESRDRNQHAGAPRAKPAKDGQSVADEEQEEQRDGVAHPQRNHGIAGDDEGQGYRKGDQKDPQEHPGGALQVLQRELRVRRWLREPREAGDS